MDQPVNIFRFSIEDAKKVASSTNEPHNHNFEEILIGMEGSIEHFIDFETTTVDAPYVCFVSKGKVHRVKPIVKDGKCDVWVIRFSSEFTAEIIFQLYSAFHNNANIFWPVERLTGRLPVLTEMMYSELRQSNPDFSVIRHLLNAVISIVLSEKQKQQTANISSNQNETFTNFLAILEENFRRPLSVGFYAEKLFMSTRNLNLICQNILQQSVSEIIETRKLMEAKNLLTTTDKTIAEIAYELGYNENSYFSNVFKKKSGQTPGEFRDEMRSLLTS
ncbi:MAG: AraC family transcriptional regulator [Xanthomarina sp.]|uniref:AraC family transcriptional regulator n=1 Tax=Xanthomarina sp. TaxID=1931211 RepID=UPI000C5AFD8B|nr:AraC family transcriptional regulator [Xanthomarina sp.]MAL23016.1 AraC family transcriptional regulator [Xanthomarina sp.]MBF62940.1 AraC family transcriptional regulator [Xanthomarina sp.]HAB26894.1 AraC family transcriptional regulator [Xanthomarina gelatinilytica]